MNIIEHFENRFLVLTFYVLLGFIFYLGLRFTSIPAAHLSVYLLPGTFFVFFISSPWLKIGRGEFFSVLGSLVTLLFLGVFVDSSVGIVISFSAVFSVFIMVGYYLVARSLVLLSISFYFCVFMFWIVALPALYYIFRGDAFLLRGFFYTSSENIVSSWLILSSSAMLSCKLEKRNWLVLFSVITCFFVSFALFTRSSIVVSFILFVFSIWVYFGRLNFLLVMFFIFCSLLVGHEAIFVVVENLLEKTKFFSSGVSSPRWGMWREYVNRVDGLSLLIGVDLKSIPIISEFSGNPHSSLIRFHSFFGILPIVFFSFVAFLLYSKQYYYYYFLAAIILLRAFTDVILFGLFYDVFLMIVVVNFLSNRGVFINSE